MSMRRAHAPSLVLTSLLMSMGCESTTAHVDAAIDAPGHTTEDTQTPAVDAPSMLGAPLALHIVRTTAFEVSLAWSAPTDATGVVGYRVFRDNAEVGSTDGMAWSDFGVSTGEHYRYLVRAIAADDSEGAPSNTVEATLPALPEDALTSLAVGEWYEFPNSFLADVAAEESRWPWLGWGERIGGIVNDWSSGALDTSRDRLYIGPGGGHRGYYGNEVYAFDLRATPPAWQRLTDPDPVIEGDECPRDPGLPCGIHTYDGLEYLPPPFDRFAQLGWDGQRAFMLNLTTNRWESQPDFLMRGRTGASAAYDPFQRVLWYNDPQGLGFYAWDIETGHWTMRGHGSLTYAHTAIFDPSRREVVAVGFGNTMTLATGLGPVLGERSVITTTGAREVEDASVPGLEYDPSTQRIVAWIGGRDVYVLDLETRVWTRQSGTGADPGIPNLNGTFGRFRYVPDLNVYVLMNEVRRNVFAYRFSEHGPRLLRRLEIRGPATLEEGLHAPLQGTAHFDDGSMEDVTLAMRCRSLDAREATIASEVITAQRIGHARIQCSYTDPMTTLARTSAALDLEVIPLSGEVIVDHLEVSPERFDTAVGTSEPFTIWAELHRGSDLIRRDVTREVVIAFDASTSWSQQDATHLTASAPSTTTLRFTWRDHEVTASARASTQAPLTAISFRPSESPTPSGWTAHADAPFTDALGRGWVGDCGTLTTRSDRRGNALQSNLVLPAQPCTFRVAMPPGEYDVMVSIGDNVWGSSTTVQSAMIGTTPLAYQVGPSNEVGMARVHVTGSEGLLVQLTGPINYLAVVPASGANLEALVQAITPAM